LDVVQSSLGLGTSDIALLAGGVFLICGVLFLGLSGNRRRRRRWLAGLGWLTLTVSVVALGYGTIRSTTSGRSSSSA
jgi:dipeptide/tripeptide permease